MLMLILCFVFVVPVSSTGGIVAFIAVLLVVLIVVVIIGAAVMFHLKRHQQHVDRGLRSPQQFAMRRVPPSAVVGYSRF